MVLVANVGTVQGGLKLLPAARPDDGPLDLLILDPRGPGGWLRALGVPMRGRRWNSRRTTVDTLVPENTSTKGVPVEFLTFRRAELTFAAAQSRELDGDPVSHGRRLTAEVRPGALTFLWFGLVFSLVNGTIAMCQIERGASRSDTEWCATPVESGRVPRSPGP
ncbi:diacylglycerol/lipid kinase family protein [Streptomyces sp. NPDC096311]|uniref:diacylglycerol/lipid kinase family protein n=1 Tax=Streptomyces sp. NPDC096311 TaxID=3366083 RepID=UPI003813EEE9